MSETKALAQQEERRLVQAAQVDLRQFAALYDVYVGRIYRYVAARVCDETVAQDLTSQVFLSALENLPRYRPDGPFAAWLFAIARHRVISYFRRQRPATSYDDLFQSPSVGSSEPVGQVEQEDSLARLRLLLHKLDGNELELLRLHFAAGLTYGEAAAVLGRSEGAVKMAVHRLLRRLQRQMEDER